MTISQTQGYEKTEMSKLPPIGKEFTVEVRVNGRVYGVGKGRRKQDAEKCAAEVALKKVGLV